MAVPQNKDELLQAIEVSFGKLMKELADIPLARVSDPVMEGQAEGTSMSVANLVANLVGWKQLVLKWLDRHVAGKAIDFPETGFKWNELGRLAGKFYRDYKDVPFQQLIERLESSKNRIVVLIAASDDQDLYGKPWYDKWTMGRMIQFNTSSPYEMHGAGCEGGLRDPKRY
ncbi:ClbS/DfsB family four-helix bundle protein [Pararhizobium sp. PWRC1-1]|uniref:ClbS/DfsB family four-helix bundle protein n=1 Tax=Pararhizobium sp. PWRC1-1 TaxID=2804566 RepID=UPI003CFB4D01